MRRTARPDALARAKARLDTLDLYPEPVDVSGVWVWVTPWLFRLPYLRRFSGMAGLGVILMRERGYSDDLLVHELCHLWQSQHAALRSWRAYLSYPYETNPYEVEARWAVSLTRPRLAAVPATLPE